MRVVHKHRGCTTLNGGTDDDNGDDHRSDEWAKYENITKCW